MEARGIASAMVEAVLAHPDQIVPEYGSKHAYQSILIYGEGRRLLLRVIVDDRMDPAVVATVYLTDQIRKYWRTG